MRDIVSREIAMSLMRLGFDEPCTGYFDEDGLKLEPDFFNKQNLNSFFSKKENINLIRISAPSISQAFRFFRKRGWYYDIYKIEGSWEYYIQHLSYSWIEEGFEDDDACEIMCLERLIDLEIIRCSTDQNGEDRLNQTLSEDEKREQLKNIFDKLKLE
jgi:hypothetical protein